MVMSIDQGRPVPDTWTLTGQPTQHTLSLTFSGSWLEVERRHVFYSYVRPVYFNMTRTWIDAPAELGETWTTTWAATHLDIKGDG